MSKKIICHTRPQRVSGYPLKAGMTALGLLLALTTSANAETVTAIKVKGNQRVDEQSVKSYLTFKTGEDFTDDDASSSIKQLFGTNLFSDVAISQENGVVSIDLVENPIISRVAFEGNKGIDDEKLEAEVSLKPRSIYTKSAVQADVQRLAEIYRSSGRYNATIEPKVILQDQNRVDLIFEITEGSRTEIQNISFTGNKAFTDSALQEVVRSAETRWYSFFSDNDKYDADRLEFDKELLRRFYTNKGYADFAVRSAVAELAPDGKGFVLTFSVDEGRKYEFGKVQVVTQLQDLKSDEFSEDLIRTKTGADYDASKVEKTVDNFVEKAGENGFAFVDVEPQISRDKPNGIIDVTYVVKEGPKVYVDRLNINGNSRTLDEVIRREFKLAEGDPFNTSSLKRSKQNVENLGFFNKVDVKQQKAGAPDKVDINVDVEEKSTGEFNFGAGYSTTDGVLGDISLRERNFLGRGQNVNIQVQASTRRQQGQFGFTEPYFMGKDLEAGFDLYSIKRDYQDESSYDQETNGINLRTGYEISDTLRHNIKYNYVQDTISDINPSASLYIRQQAGTNVTSLIGHSLMWDERDSRQNPRDGYFLRFGQDFAGLGGDSSFVRHEIGAGYYIPLTEEKEWTLNFSLDAGNVTKVGEDVPINHRFFVGGRNFRGFDRAGIGPRDSLTKDALGGNSYYIGSVETVFPLGLPEELGFTGALFTDVGSLWGLDGNGAGIVDDNSPRVSIGAGLGWKSPFGPIRVDFALPVVKDDQDETQNFQLNFGTRF